MPSIVCQIGGKSQKFWKNCADLQTFLSVGAENELQTFVRLTKK
jgi:hypothetical protein